MLRLVSESGHPLADPMVAELTSVIRMIREGRCQMVSIIVTDHDGKTTTRFTDYSEGSGQQQVA